jgi:hypothetical protein
MSYTSNIGGKLIVNAKGSIKTYAKEDIELNSAKTITLTGKEKGVSFGEPEKAPVRESQDFDLEFYLDKENDTIVPFGIFDFNDKYENPYFSFKYMLSRADIDSLNFQIIDEDGKTIYQMGYLQTVVVEASKKPLIFNGITEKKKDKKDASKTIDFAAIYLKYTLQEPDYTKIGTYHINWDGFDNNEVYDSTLFNGKKLKAKLTATKNGKSKSIEIDFTTDYHCVPWVDTKIDKKAKRIDVALRVNLKDGGAKGLDSWNNTRNFNTPHTKSEICDWDKIPQDKIKPNNPIIKQRSRSYDDLSKLAKNGFDYHWGRNRNHAEGKNVIINDGAYEVFVNLINTKEDTLGKLDLIFNTNGDWMRSGNPGSIKDPMTLIGNLISREAICYNVGYIKYSNNVWAYSYQENEDLEFKFTSAHEIGHEILKKYGGTFYSYGHKGSVNSVTQSSNENATKYPISGEIDIMPYYTNALNFSEYKRYVAEQRDVLSLIWLTKIKIN